MLVFWSNIEKCQHPSSIQIWDFDGISPPGSAVQTRRIHPPGQISQFHPPGLIMTCRVNIIYKSIEISEIIYTEKDAVKRALENFEKSKLTYLDIMKSYRKDSIKYAELLNNRVEEIKLFKKTLTTNLYCSLSSVPITLAAHQPAPAHRSPER